MYGADGFGIWCGLKWELFEGNPRNVKPPGFDNSSHKPLKPRAENTNQLRRKHMLKPNFGGLIFHSTYLGFGEFSASQ